MRIVVAATDSELRAQLCARLVALDLAAIADVDGEAALAQRLASSFGDLVITADGWPQVGAFVRCSVRYARPIAVLLKQLDALDSHPALRAGAAAVLPWDTPPQRLAAALHAVVEGLRVLPRAAAAGRMASPMLPDPTRRPLSERERQVLEQIASGLPNKEIARRLSVSPNTVKQHVTAIFEKLSVRTRAEAYREAVRRGELTL